MMRTVCLALLLLVPTRAIAQEARVLTALGLEPVVWSRWETRVPDIQRWLAQAMIPVDSGAAVNNYHHVDVDGDGRTDVLFSGWVPCSGRCGESSGSLRTLAYLDANGRYSRAYDSPRPVVALVRREPLQPLVLVLGEATPDPQAMCEGDERSFQFRSVATRGDTTFWRDFHVLRYRTGMQWPPAPLPTPLRVRVTQDRYNLRAAPVVDDTTVMWDGSCEGSQRGNVIAAFALGTMAVAVAQQRVGPRIWYLVVTDEGSVQTPVPDGARGPERWTTSPPLRMRDRFVGWMSSRWLEVLTDSVAPLPWPPGPPARP